MILSKKVVLIYDDTHDANNENMFPVDLESGCLQEKNR